MDDAVIDIVDRTFEVIKQRLSETRKTGIPCRTRQDQFQSLYLKLPRGYGVTSAAIQLLFKYPNALIITWNTRTAEYTNRDSDVDPDRIYTLDRAVDYARGNHRFHTVDLLIYDPASCMLDDQKSMRRIDELNTVLDNFVTMFAYLG